MQAEEALEIVLKARDHSKEVSIEEEAARKILRTLVAMRRAAVNNNPPIYHKLARELAALEQKGIY